MIKVGDNEPSLLRIYHKHVQDLYNYGMHAIGDSALVKNALRELFVNIGKQDDSPVTVRTLRFYLFKRFRDLVVRQGVASGKSCAMFTQPHNPFDIGAEEEHSRQQREAVFLKFYGEFNYHEIAALMTIDPKLAYNLVVKAVEIAGRNGERYPLIVNS